MSRYTHLTVRAAALTGLAALCRTHGVDAAGLLRDADLPRNIETEPDRRVPVLSVNLAFELAAVACGCEDFGLRLSELRGFANLGPISLLARDEPTVGGALAAIEAYLPLHNDALAIARERYGAVVVIKSNVLGPGPKIQASDIAVAMLNRILVQLAGRDWRPEEACLTRARPADVARFRQVLGPRIRFNAEFDGIVVRADVLDRPNPMADAGLKPYASQLFRAAGAERFGSTTDRVRHMLALLLANGRCTAGYVASRLGLSRRTLTRKLADEGTRFLELLDEAREEVARRQLAAGLRSLADISELLGFSSPAAFSTWFRHRHGVAPREWRKREVGI